MEKRYLGSEMEQQEKTKRVRDGEDETQMGCFENNKKKRDVYDIDFTKDVEEEGCSKARDSNLAFGVFDFPWLKDGVTSKSEDYLLDFEDKFSSSLEQEDASFEAASIDFSKGEIPDASLAQIPETKLEDNAWHWKPFESDMLELEAEDVYSIWSSLLNQPL